MVADHGRGLKLRGCNTNPQDKEEDLAPSQIYSHPEDFATTKPEMLNLTVAVRYWSLS